MGCNQKGLETSLLNSTFKHQKILYFNIRLGMKKHFLSLY